MEILTSLQKDILNEFVSVPDNEAFYLTGGTALAGFYLKHRRSNDLDLFTDKAEVILPFSFNFEKTLQDKGFSVTRSRGLHSFVELMVKRGGDSTIIHLAQDSPFRFEEAKPCPAPPGIKIDGLMDIASNKLLALFQRATLRDFVDIYFLVKDNYFTEDELIALAKEKDPGFDLYWLAVAFERINLFTKDTPDLLLLLRHCTLSELIAFFDRWRTKISKELTA